MGMVGMILLGAGGVSLIGGVISSFQASYAHDDLYDAVSCPPTVAPPECDAFLNGEPQAKQDERKDRFADAQADLDMFHMLSGVMYGLGGVGVVTGLVLVLIDDGGDDATEPAASFQVTPTPGGVFSQATVRF